MDILNKSTKRTLESSSLSSPTQASSDQIHKKKRYRHKKSDNSKLQTSPKVTRASAKNMANHDEILSVQLTKMTSLIRRLMNFSIQKSQLIPT